MNDDLDLTFQSAFPDLANQFGKSSSRPNMGTIAGGFGALAGLGLSAVGAFDQYGAAKQTAAASAQTAQLEMQQNAVRQQAMHVASRRQSMQTLRQAQQAQAQNLASATSQGAQFGSGLAGGQASASGQAGNNLLGINQNLEAGDKMFALSSQIDQQKIAMANAQSQSAFGGALGGLGGDLSKAIGPMMNLAMTFGPML